MVGSIDRAHFVAKSHSVAIFPFRIPLETMHPRVYSSFVIDIRDGKSRPGPRAKTGRHGPNDFLFKISLFIVRWTLGSNKGNYVLVLL